MPPLPIDGKDAWPVLSGRNGATTPHEALFYYLGWNLQAVRSGRWKLHLPHAYHHVDQPGSGGLPGKASRQRQELALFDLRNDVGEATDVAARHRDVVERLTALAETCREDLGDGKRPGRNRRPPGKV